MTWKAILLAVQFALLEPAGAAPPTSVANADEAAAAMRRVASSYFSSRHDEVYRALTDGCGLDVVDFTGAVCSDDGLLFKSAEDGRRPDTLCMIPTPADLDELEHLTSLLRIWVTPVPGSADTFTGHVDASAAAEWLGTARTPTDPDARGEFRRLVLARARLLDGWRIERRGSMWVFAAPGLCDHALKHVRDFRVEDALEHVPAETHCKLGFGGNATEVTIRLTNESRTELDRFVASIYVKDGDGASIGNIVHYRSNFSPPIAPHEQREIQFEVSADRPGARTCEVRVTAVPSHEAVRRSVPALHRIDLSDQP